MGENVGSVLAFFFACGSMALDAQKSVMYYSKADLTFDDL
jgi:hypothetical protein